MHQTDIVIIGAGPVGLFAAFQAGMLGLKCHIVDSLDEIGGQCTALYPEKPIYDIPAYSQIEAQQLITELESQAAPFDPTYHLRQTVNSLTKSEQGWDVATSRGILIHTKVVIIAAGGGAFGPNRPPLNDIESYEGKSLFYMVRDKAALAGKRVVIAGGGDSAVDWALSLADIAESIQLVHRRQKFRCAPDSHHKLLELVKQKKVELVIPYQLADLKGTDGQLEQVIVKDLDNQTKGLDADVLLAFFGLAMELGPINDWNLDIQNRHIQVEASTMKTSQSGILAIGDIITYPGKLKLILTGFAEAALAVHTARSVIFPDQQFHFEYSTTQGVPKES